MWLARNKNGTLCLFNDKPTINHSKISWAVKNCDYGYPIWNEKMIARFPDVTWENSPVAYCGIDCGDAFHVSVEISWWADGNIFPATKEQCDFLFQEMKEAGYEWDAEKKELKKIEQTAEIPFGAKDSDLEEVTYHIPDGYHAEINGNEVVIKKGEQKSL